MGKGDLGVGGQPIDATKKRDQEGGLKDDAAVDVGAAEPGVGGPVRTRNGHTDKAEDEAVGAHDGTVDGGVDGNLNLIQVLDVRHVEVRGVGGKVVPGRVRDVGVGAVLDDRVGGDGRSLALVPGAVVSVHSGGIGEHPRDEQPGAGPGKALYLGEELPSAVVGCVRDRIGREHVRADGAVRL